MLRLIQRESCPYCAPVRQRLTDLNISYININVPKDRSLRDDLVAITGNPYIPAVVDDDIVIPGQLESHTDVMRYIDEKYGEHSSVKSIRRDSELTP